MQSSSMIKFLCRDPPERKHEATVIKDNKESNFARFQAARARLSEIATPASPSPPPREPVKHTPIVIPTEQVKRYFCFFECSRLMCKTVSYNL